MNGPLGHERDGRGNLQVSRARRFGVLLVELVDGDCDAGGLQRLVRGAFDDPDIHRVEVRVPASAHAARQALDALGAVHEATLRQPDSRSPGTSAPPMIHAVHRDELTDDPPPSVTTHDHDLRLRTASHLDVEALFGIKRSAFGVGYDRGQLRQLLALFPGLTRLAFVGDQAVGCSICGIVHNEPANAWMLSMGVQRAWQGTGIGTSLLVRSLDDLRQHGVDNVRLSVDPQRERTVAFYHSHGFRPVEQVADYFGPGEARTIMRCTV